MTLWSNAMTTYQRFRNCRLQKRRFQAPPWALKFGDAEVAKRVQLHARSADGRLGSSLLNHADDAHESAAGRHKDPVKLSRPLCPECDAEAKAGRSEGGLGVGDQEAVTEDKIAQGEPIPTAVVVDRERLCCDILNTSVMGALVGGFALGNLRALGEPYDDREGHLLYVVLRRARLCSCLTSALLYHVVVRMHDDLIEEWARTHKMPRDAADEVRDGLHSVPRQRHPQGSATSRATTSRRPSSGSRALSSASCRCRLF